MENNRQAVKINRSISLWPTIIILAGIVAVSAGAAISPSYWDFFGLLLTLSLATLLGGMVFGFLFGIPRLNRNYDPREDYDRTTKYSPNTNLEEVSDWLTKIIIGVTLTQMTKIPSYLQRIADKVLQNTNCETMDCNFAGAVIIAGIIYFFIAGFIIGYFYTRLFLPDLFSMMEEQRIRKAEVSIWREGHRKSLSTAEVSAIAGELPFLTDDEKEILQMIKAANNAFTGLHRLTPRQHGAVNVLLAKGIIETDSGSLPAKRRSISITDPDLLQALP